VQEKVLGKKDKRIPPIGISAMVVVQENRKARELPERSSRGNIAPDETDPGAGGERVGTMAATAATCSVRIATMEAS
jgi:hypothetical protein